MRFDRISQRAKQGKEFWERKQQGEKVKVTALREAGQQARQPHRGQ